MSNPQCIIPEKGIDDKIAEKVPAWNSYIVAVLRNLYENTYGTLTGDIDTLANTLVKFRKDLKGKDLADFNDAVLNPVAAYDQLKLAFPETRKRLDRINLVATLFETVVDTLESKYPNLDRDEIIMGFTANNGKRQFGPTLIYQAVYNEINRRAGEAWDNENIPTYNAYIDVIRNWGALVTYANSVIRDLENINIGVNLTYADKSADANVDDSFVESFSMEESTKERWQESVDSINPVQALSPVVKRVLNTLPLYTDKGNREVDDLGIPRRASTSKMYQTMQNILQGMSGEADMMNRLEQYKDSISWMDLLINKLGNDPLLKTQFYVNFGKCFQRYAMEDTEVKSNIHTFKFKILNKLSRKASIKQYLSVILNNRTNTENTLFKYTDDTNNPSVEPYFNKKAAENLSKLILQTLPKEQDKGESVFSNHQDTLTEFVKKPMAERKKFYSEVFNYLGLSLTDNELTIIASDYRKMRALNKAISELPIQLSKIPESFTFLEALNKKYGENAKEGFLYEKIGKIVNIVDSVSSAFTINRITFQDNAYFSNVESSYLGRFINRIEAISKKGDIRPLREFIENRFLRNEFFSIKTLKGKQVIANRWLKDLYESDMYDPDSLVHNLTYARLLGDRDDKFENFGPKKQLLNQIFNYFSESQDNTTKAKYGWYPVFILGDSGSSKWIRAKRYTGKEIIDGLYNVYLQERVLQRQLNEVKELLTREGKALGSLKNIDTTKFALLEFLNDVEIDEDNIEESVKKHIRTYLDKCTEEIIKELEDVGAFVQEGNKYKYLEKLTKFPNPKAKDRGELIRNSLQEYTYNSIFATIMQMELMTISPIFYKNGSSIDLQKRFKEIHASGNILSTEARDFKGRKFSESPYQKTVYFNDIKINPEETNAEFMEVIKNLFGEDSDIYKKYRDDTSLTDGQGYRTLKSYRSVMGMAGKWTRKCEDAYNELENIRKEIRENGGPTEEQIEKIEELQLVLQPIKPFMYTLEEYPVIVGGEAKVVQIPVQMKYAEALVIPELLPKESKLRRIIEWAESEEVNVVAATTTTKVGDFGSVEVDEATDEDSLLEALGKAKIHELDYNDYVIQTNVPEHIQGSQLFATQSRKVSFSNLRQTDDNGRDIDYSNYIGGETAINLGGNRPVKPTAYNINRLYVALMAANILQDFESFKNIVNDPEKLRQALIQMTLNNSRETRDNLKGYSKGLDSDFIMSLFEGGIEQDTASLLLSLYKKKVNKQKILGGSAVQVSAFGITGYSDKDDFFKFYKDPDNNKNILYGTCEIPWDLSYTNSKGEKIQLDFNTYCNPDGTLKLSNEKLDPSDSRYKDYLPYTDKEGNVCIPLIEKEFPGILSFIAYRIPTEEKYSMLNMKITRFSLKTNGGGTIKVPAQGTTIAGFDFDIDKLYFMRREYIFGNKREYKNLSEETKNRIWAKVYKDNYGIKKMLEDEKERQGGDKPLNYYWDFVIFSEDKNEKFEEAAKKLGIKLNEHEDKEIPRYNYDFGRTPWDRGQSRAARNNLLITLIQKRLEDPTTAKDRLTPGGFDLAKKAAAKIRELMGIDYNSLYFAHPLSMIRFNQQNQLASKLIGIFANQNANHNMASLMSKFELKKPISFGSVLDNGQKLVNLINPNALTKELLAASVDAVKDPVLNFLNLNTITADSAGLLCRLGYGFYDIGLLMNQPIIVELCKECDEQGIYDIQGYIEQKLRALHADNYKKQVQEVQLGTKTLEEALKDKDPYTKDSTAISTQIAVLQLFYSIYKSANEVSNFIQNTKFTAANSVKSNFGSLYAQADRVNSYIESINSTNSALTIEVSNDQEKPIVPNMLEDSRGDLNEYFRELGNNPFGYEQVMYDTVIGALKLLSKYYPYNNNTFKDAREYLKSIMKNNPNEDLINKLHTFVIKYLAANASDSIFNPNYPINAVVDGDTVQTFTAKEYFTTIVPKLVAENIDDLKEKYSIFKYMDTTIDENNNVILSIRNVGGLLNEEKEEIRDSWEELLESNKPLAYDLYFYSYYQSGFGFGSIGFNHLCPLALKLGLEVGYDYYEEGGIVKSKPIMYADFLRNILTQFDMPISKSKFCTEFIKENRNNKSLVYTPFKETKSTLENLVSENKEEITVDANNGNLKSLLIKTVTKKTATGATTYYYFRPAIVINNQLYIVDGGENFNISTSGNMTYKLVKTEPQKSEVVHLSQLSQSQQENDSQTNIPMEKENIPEYEPIIDIDTLSNDGIIDEIRRYSKGNPNVQSILKGLDNTNRGNLLNTLTSLYQENGVRCKTNGDKIC